MNQYIGKPDLLIEGRLPKDPVVKSRKIEYWVNVRYISIHDSTFPAFGRVSLSNYDVASTTLRYGGEIVAKGMLEKAQGRRNPGGFDCRAYLKTRGIDALFRMDKHCPIQSTGESKGSRILKTVYPARRWIATAISSQYSGRSEALIKALISDFTSKSGRFRNFLDTAYARQIPIRQIVGLDSLFLSSAKFYFISPDSLMRQRPNHNNKSIITLLCYGNNRMLLTGDAETPVETHLMRSVQPLEAEVLKAGHHGSKTSSSEGFLKQVDPHAAAEQLWSGQGRRFAGRSPSVQLLYPKSSQSLQSDHGYSVLAPRGLPCDHPNL